MPFLAQAGDFEISVQRKKDGGSQPTAGIIQKTSQNWVGDVKIENRGFKPAQDLVARYILFVKRQRAGQQQGEDQVEKIKGEYKVAELKNGASINFSTSSVKLRHQQLSGNYYFVGGGISKADDSIVGVWIKLFKGQAEVWQYVNPTTVTSKFKWK